MSVNSRQGTARNIGIKNAKGKYIQFLDADDYLQDGGLAKLLDVIDRNDSDIIMFDSKTINEEGRVMSYMHYSRNPQIRMSGQEYLLRAEVPWVPWLSLMKRDFLAENNLSFAEKVRFEDTDFMLKSYLLAKTIIYKPICAVCHVINPFSTVNVGRDCRKVEEQFMTTARLADTISFYRESYHDGTNVLSGHYDHMYDTIIKRTLWRLNYRQITNILKSYPYLSGRRKISKIASNHPNLYASMAFVFKPMLYVILKIKKSLNK